MIAIIYVSRAVQPFDRSSLKTLVDAAALNNERCDITGFLAYFGDRFMQYLEGQQTAVSELVEKIRRDPRHDDFDLHSLGSIEKRCFPGWAMHDLSSVDGVRLEHLLQQNLAHWHGSGFTSEERRAQALAIVMRISAVKHLLVA